MPVFPHAIVDPAAIHKTVHVGVRFPSSLEDRFTISVCGDKTIGEKALSHIDNSFREAGIELAARVITEPVTEHDAKGNSILVCAFSVFPKNRQQAKHFAVLFAQFLRGHWERPVSAYRVALMMHETRRKAGKNTYRRQLG